MPPVSAVSILGEALAGCLSRGDGTLAAYLPDGVGRAIADALVARANDRRQPPGKPPYAILVTSGEETAGPRASSSLSVNDALRYRKGDRLALVLGRVPQVESFKSFRTVLTKSFPDDSAHGIGLADLAEAALDRVLVAARVGEPTRWDRQGAIDRLASCLEALRDTHRALQQGIGNWNAYWFKHVDEGMANLVDGVRRYVASAPAADLGRVFEQLTYPSFALPTPKNGHQLEPSDAGKAVAAALAEWWSSADQLQVTLGHLAEHPDTMSDEEHPLAEVDWADFDREIAGQDNLLLALQRTAFAGARGLDGFVALTERQFFSPLPLAAKDRALIVRSTDNGPLSIHDSKEGSPYLVPAPGVAPGAATQSGQTVVHSIWVPLGSEPTAEQVALTDLSITAAATGYHWAVHKRTLRLDSDAWWLVLTGTLGWAPEAAVGVAPVRLEVDVSGDDSLRSLVAPDSGCALVVAPLATSGAIWFVERSGKWVGATTLRASLDAEEIVTEVSADQVYSLIAWTESGPPPMLNGEEMGQWSRAAALYAGTLRPAGLDSLMLGETVVRFTAPEPEYPAKSPIISAIWRRSAATASLTDETVDSLRGRYETSILRDGDGDSWRRANGHLVLSTGDQFGMDHIEPVETGAFLAPKDWSSIWEGRLNFIPSPDVVDSSQAVDFRAAFDRLEVGEALRRGRAGGQDELWPSQASWRSLWSARRTELAAYLDTYAELVRHARHVGDSAGIFWAAYPWSVSAWSRDGCEAVLLSPLHPIRLAWVAAAEGVLWDADEPIALAGAIEGWNFPFIAPGSSQRGRLVAIPIDNGEDQIFLGWSMVATGSIAGTKALTPPTLAGGRRLPGSAASGLNAAAVDSALRDFRRVNPHVSTVTIDLAADSPASRLGEVDEAVLSSAVSWASEGPSGGDSREPIGVRILDSTGRSGEPPRGTIADIVSRGVDAPISWARYTSRAGDSEVCNVRLLQDSGIRLEVSHGEANCGMVAHAPLRRFEVAPPDVLPNGRVVARPALGPDGGWAPFVSAVRAVEAADECPALETELIGTLLVDERADWTVSGEALVGPAALARLVNKAGTGAQMLWEWRPPFLSADVGRRGHSPAVLERRPFVSVVRVPQTFSDQIGSLLSRALGAPVGADRAIEMLEVLGARGVGLSSLTAMGGTHSAGAVGFYLTMKLLDSVRDDDADILVIPIDACEPFLRALGSSGITGRMRRADLLVLRVEAERVQLLPIEIKLHGLLAGEPASSLPRSGDQRLEDPLDQLASSVATLGSLIQRGLDVLASESESALWRNAFLALIEAGLRLRPSRPSDSLRLSTAFAAIAGGTAAIELAHPVVCFFAHEATAPDGGGPVVAELGCPALQIGADVGIFAVNVGAALREVDEGGGACIESWGRVVEWAFTDVERPSIPATAHEPVAGSSSSLLPEPEEGLGLSDQAWEDAISAADAPETATDGIAKDDVSQEPLEYAAAGPPARPRDEVPTEGSDSGGGLQAAVGSAAGASRAPAECPDGVRFGVGTFLSSSAHAPAHYWPGNTALTQMNVGVVGDLGTGKTQLLKALVGNLRHSTRRCQDAPATVLIFDYKRDYQDDPFLSTVGGRVLAPVGIPLNIFSLSAPYTPLAAVQKAKSFIDVLTKIYGGIGPVQRNALTRVITDLFQQSGGLPPTMGEVLEAYREQIPSADAVVGVMNDFVLGQVFSEDRAELVSFAELVDSSVLVVALNELGVDQHMKNALVVLFLNQYFDYMQGLSKPPFSKGANGVQLRGLNSFLLVDEATNIMRYDFQVLQDIMLQGREFGVGTILASQYLSHFRSGGTNYGQPLRTWFVHRVPTVTRQQLVALGIPSATDASASEIMELGLHEALYVTDGVPGRLIQCEPFYALQSGLGTWTS